MCGVIKGTDGPTLRGNAFKYQWLRNWGASEDIKPARKVHRSIQVHELCQRPDNGAAVGEREKRTADQDRRRVSGQFSCARARLKNGLSQLANQARQLARQDATELVQRFGELGRRKFNLAA